MNEIDRAAVEQFVAGATGATKEQIAAVALRMERMVKGGERAKLGSQYVSIATMAETARRLREMIRSNGRRAEREMGMMAETRSAALSAWEAAKEAYDHAANAYNASFDPWAGAGVQQMLRDELTARQAVLDAATDELCKRR